MAYAHSRFQLRVEGGPSIEFGTGGVPSGADPDSCGYTRSAGAVIYDTTSGDQYVFDGTNWDQQLNADSTFQDAADTLDAVQDVITAPDAQTDTYCHAKYNTGTDVNFPGPFTNPDVPRNIKMVYDALYDGGNTTVTGTDINDNVISEVITVSAGATVLGTKVFKTVTAAVQAALGAGGVGASIGVGVKLGLSEQPADKVGSLSRGGIVEDGTWDDTAASWGVTPTNLPDGATDYVAEYQKAGATSVVTATP